MPGFVSIGSRRYAEGENLALQATTEQQVVDEVIETATEPMVDRPQYEPLTKILSGGQERRKAVVVLSASAKELTTAQDIAGEVSTGFQPEEEGRINTTEPKGVTKSGDIFPEEIENNMAVLPEVEATSKEVTIDDIQVDDPHATPEERERLRRIIWKRRHLLIGTAPQFREKLSMLIKGLLSAKIITTSTSPWALMIYPMALINGLLEDLDKALWYYSLDMASGFWVTRMPFGLKNAPQIYQRIVDNALYGRMRIKPDQDSLNPVDVFEEGEPEPEPKPSVLGRTSYVDDILVTSDSWDSICNHVDEPLDVCERLNLSISVVKSYWGRRKVAYLGHEVSSARLEAKPKELDAIANLPFPTKLKAMHSFLGSLNYYSRFIEDFAVYAAILWARAKNAFTMLKAKSIATPVLKHFDPERTPVIVLYANKWTILAALMQEHEGVYHPVTFTSRTMKANELNYGVVYKE
ncbi:reverse transcriptase, partial [Phytophthora megakarya]